MKRAIDIISVVCIVAASVLMLSLYSFEAQVSRPPEPNKAEATTFADFPLDQARLVDLEIDEETRDNLTARELRDQFRDWLMFTALSDTDLSAEEAGQCIFDVPTIRYGYTQPVANFEYGESRSCCVRGGEALALIPAGISEDKRADHLAHIADEHRKSLGEIPRSLLVFEYEIRPKEELGVLTRRNRLDGKELFTQRAGYHEAQIDGLGDLQAFMKQVDDITYARMGRELLILGGRKLQGREYRGIRVEDVAAIWQAERKIHSELTEFRNRWQRRLDALNSVLKRTYNNPLPGFEDETLQRLIGEQRARTNENLRKMLRQFGQRGDTLRQIALEDSYAPPARISSKAQYDEEYNKLNLAMWKERRELCLVDGSGFSLDPNQDYDRLKAFLAEITPGLKSVVEHLTPAVTMDDIDAARSGLEKREVVPYLILAEKIHNAVGEEIQRIESMPREERKGELRAVATLLLAETMKKTEGITCKFQAARYDGDLQGTEAGMVLFYTDLLAKLWAIDYLGSSPDRFIEDFQAMPETPVSPIYLKEMGELTATRLWFGPRDEGFQMTDGGGTLLFARTATRVYAASSNPLEPGVEQTANAQSAAFLNWWNDHYEEVARFEPEYERLNQIMKWSLLISWLNKADKGGLLGFLAACQVDRSNWFPEWVKRQPQLRFTNWDRIGFHERGYLGTSTEAMPILCSDTYVLAGSEHYLAGGVSLAPKALFETRAGISSEIGALIRRSNLDYATSTGGNLSTLGGAKYSFKALAPDRTSIIARAKDAAKLRGRYSELANLDFELAVSRTPRRFGFRSSAGGNDIGGLAVTKTQGGFRTAWSSRDLDVGQSLARRISKDPSPERMLANDPAVEVAIKLPREDGSYLVRMSGSGRWLKMAPEEKPSVSLAEGWQSRVADPTGGHNMQLAWVDDSAITNEFGAARSLVMEPIEGTDRSILRCESIRGPPAEGKVLEIDAGSTTITGRVDLATGRVELPWEQLPGALKEDPSRLRRLLLPSDLQEIRRIANTEVPTVRVTVSGNRIAADDFLRKLGRGDYNGAARDIVANPRAFKDSFEQRIVEELHRSDAFLSGGQPVKAIHHLEGLIDAYGPRPEFTLRRAIAQLDRRKVPSVPDALKGTARQPLNDRMSFFDEINERLSRSDLSQAQRNSFRRLAEYADWTDRQARKMVPEGEIVPTVEGDELVLHCGLATPRKGQPVGLADIDGLANGGAPVYVQDSPGLNNLDWSASLDSSLQQVITGNLGAVVRLPRSDIAHWRPATVYSPSAAPVKVTTKTLAPTGRYGNALQFRLVTRSPVPAGRYDPNDFTSKRDQGQGVYLVIPDTDAKAAGSESL